MAYTGRILPLMPPSKARSYMLITFETSTGIKQGKLG